MVRPLALCGAVALVVAIAGLTGPPAQAAPLGSLTCLPKQPGLTNLAWICTASAVDSTGAPLAGEVVCFSADAAEWIGPAPGYTTVPDPEGQALRVCVLTNGSGAAAVEILGRMPITVNADFVNLNENEVFVISEPSEPTAEELIEELGTTIDDLALPSGTANALTAKLEEAATALASGDVAEACGSLAAFSHYVDAQTGKKLTAAEAADLTAAIQEVRAELGC